MLKIDDLLGVRFAPHGRSVQEGFDCYGLAIEVSKRLGHRLGDVWYTKADNVTFTKNYDEILGLLSDTVKETDEYVFGNLIVFGDGHHHMVHIGVLIDDERFIHCDNRGVRISFLDEYFRKERKVYEWLR